MARHRVRLPDFAALASLVGAGIGVAVMPESAARRHAGAQARLVPLADAWARRHLVIGMTAAGAAMPTVQALVAALRASP